MYFIMPIINDINMLNIFKILTDYRFLSFAWAPYQL